MKTGRSLKRLSRKGSRHQERRQMQQSVLSQQTYKFTVLGTEFTKSRKMNWCKFAWQNCHCNQTFIQTSEVTYLLTTLCAVPCTWELRLWDNNHTRGEKIFRIDNNKTRSDKFISCRKTKTLWQTPKDFIVRST